jgi:putative phage-type endonuclease
VTEELEGPQPDDLLDQRKAFDEERRMGIFSTDVAAILGLARYGTALSVYRSKRGESEPRPPSLASWIGTRLENLVAEMYSAATQNRVRSDNQAHFHPTYDWLGCHLDRRVVGDSALIVELKTRHSARGWGEDGTADIPPETWCQVQEQLFVTGARECHVAVLFSNSSYRTYRLLPDAAFEKDILPTLSAFWFENFLPGVPPVPTGHDIDTEISKRIPGGDTGDVKPATPEQSKVVEQFRLARLNEAQAANVRAGLQNQIREIIGREADGLRGPFGVITWKRTADWTKIEWKLVANAYRAAAEELLGMATPTTDEDVAQYAHIQATLPLVEELYSEKRPGVRRFNFDFVED